ncbi:hypothetical protein R3P38DRAFT_2503802, partial [Favolaschia claudopus]
WLRMRWCSEFAGERMNGLLQQVKTNKKNDDMPLTMLRQMARRCRLETKLRDEQANGSQIGQLSSILQPDTAAETKAAMPLSESKVAEILTAAKDLNEDDYELLLDYQISKGQPWLDWRHLPHPIGLLILPPCALRPTEFKMKDHVFSRRNSTWGNSNLQFKDPETGLLCTGFIDEIWQMPMEGHLQTFIVIHKHKHLPNALLGKTPYPIFPLFQATVVDTAEYNTFCIIEPHHILTHLTVYRRPKGTYGINREILVICLALNRGKLTI